MRYFTRYLGSSLLIGGLVATSSGCVSSAQRTPGAGISVQPAAGSPPVEPTLPPVPVTPPPTPTPARQRIAWVNPARCLTACAYDPTPELVRINRQGDIDARGKFRLAAETQAALLVLLQAARAAGHELRIESSFRSYDDQARVFTEIKEPGRAARPGHSEHQLGTVADLKLPTSAAIDWLAGHAYEFGFALSYPPNKQRITGYRPEPWHVRFVGRELAEELHDRKMILEEYFRAQPGVGESGACEECPLPVSQAACGEVTREGSCHGSVLTWCYEGTLAAVDCATSEQQCGRADNSAEYDCLPKPPQTEKSSP